QNRGEHTHECIHTMPIVALRERVPQRIWRQWVIAMTHCRVSASSPGGCRDGPLGRRSISKPTAPSDFARILPVRNIPLRAWILALLSSGLQILIFPKTSFYFLSWVAVTPLLYALLCGRGGAGALVDSEGRSLRPFTLWQGFLL